MLDSYRHGTWHVVPPPILGASQMQCTHFRQIRCPVLHTLLWVIGPISVPPKKPRGHLPSPSSLGICNATLQKDCMYYTEPSRGSRRLVYWELAACKPGGDPLRPSFRLGPSLPHIFTCVMPRSVQRQCRRLYWRGSDAFAGRHTQCRPSNLRLQER